MGYKCYVIVAFRDLGNAAKKYPRSRTLPVMHARMQNETLKIGQCTNLWFVSSILPMPSINRG